MVLRLLSNMISNYDADTNFTGHIYKAYILNLRENSDTGTHSTALCALNNIVTPSESFAIENILNEIDNFLVGSLINISTITRSSVAKNVYRKREYDLVTYGWFCIGFIYFILKVKT